MKKICSLNKKEMVSKKAVIISILTLSLVCAALASMITVAFAKTGGVLYVDGEEVGKEVFVAFGEEYEIEIRDIPCDFKKDETIEIQIAGGGWIYTAEVKQDSPGEEKYIDPIEWECPFELEYCQTYVVQFRAKDGDPSGAYVAQGTLLGDIVPGGGHLHAIPEFGFGTVMAILSSLSGLAVFSKFRK